MEQAKSATKAAFDPLFPGTTVIQDAWSGSCPQGRHAPSPIVVNQRAGSGRSCVRLPRVPQGDGALSFNEATATRPSNLGGANPMSAPIDYARATSEQLLEAARSLDKDAFTELSGRHAESVHRKVFRIVRNHEDTEDIVQEALFKAYTHLSEFRGSCAFSTWLMTIAINSALMLLRKRKKHSEVSFDQSRSDDQAWGPWEFADPHLDAERTYARRQTMVVLSRAVRGLPVSYRSVLERIHVQEQSMQEAADMLGLTVPAVKSRLLRARINLRANLASKGISIADGYS